MFHEIIIIKICLMQGPAHPGFSIIIGYIFIWVLLVSHYLHLIEFEGADFSRAMIIRGSLERLVPVLMTALTAALALIPLVLAHGEPGKEILAPVATVILGGLVSTTLLDTLVTPAAFARFGRSAAAAALARRAVAEGTVPPEVTP